MFDKIKDLFNSKMLEGFVFSVLCATIFTAGATHWLLDPEYMYKQAAWGHDSFVNFNWVFAVAAVVSLYYLLRKKAIQWDFTLIILCQTLLLVAVHDYHYENYFAINYAWILPIAYIVGKLAVGTDINKIDDKIFKLYIALMAGLFLVAMLDFYSNVRGLHGRFLYYERYYLITDRWHFFWTDDVESRCTLELGMLLVTSATGFAIAMIDEHPIFLRFIFIADVVIQWLDINVEGRENRLLLPIVLITTCILYVVNKYREFSVKTKKLIKVLVLVIPVLIGLFVALFWTNRFGLYDKYLASNWSSEGGILKNIRFVYDYEGFKAMLQYPLEDYFKYVDIANPHSMILKYGRIYDMTIYVGLSLARVLMIKDAIVFISQKCVRNKVKYLLFPAFISVNLYYSMEANAFDHRYFWMVGMLISGMIRGWLEAYSDSSSHFRS